MLGRNHSCNSKPVSLDGNLAPAASSHAISQANSILADAPQEAICAMGGMRTGNRANTQLLETVDKLNRAMQQSNADLVFSINEPNHAIVTVVDARTETVIERFPSREAAAISKAIDHFHKELFFEQKT
jgi:uncharacterized FlaG/YvyC family protein